MPSDSSKEIDVVSTPQRWERSPSPEDPWGDFDSNAEWGFDIIGEEVDYDGNVLLEVRWDDWSRADGTKTTWEPANKPSIDSSRYRKMQKMRRQQLALESLEIEVPTTNDVHNTETFLRSQAYEEKLARAKKEPPPNRIREMAELMKKHQVATSDQVRRSVRQHTDSSCAASSTSLGRSASRGMSSSSSINLQSSISKSSQPPSSNNVSIHNAQSTSEPAPILASNKTKGKQSAVNIEPPPLPSDYTSSPRKRVKRVVQPPHAAPSSVGSPMESSSSSLMIEVSLPGSTRPRENAEAKRKRLQTEWMRAAEKKGAATITFVNDVDEEAIPPIDKSFVYLESEYKFAPGIKQPDSGFLVSCDCVTCGPLPATCGCQVDWEQHDFAYTPSGLFAFNVPKNVEVIECNKGCACSVETCMNSVSQRPRRTPIEVFKTTKRGWGVRSPVAIPRGKVIGIYTGLLMRREAAIALPASLGAYCFDLDGNEFVPTGSQLSQPSQSDQSQPGPSQGGSQSTQSSASGCYSVDSRLAGNWTRFINHSCTPNLEVYLVAHDRPVSSNMPYIVFVANTPIAPRTEFTFDYEPAVAANLKHQEFMNPGKKKGKSKEKLVIPEGAMECLCDSRECRGYFRGV